MRIDKAENRTQKINKQTNKPNTEKKIEERQRKNITKQSKERKITKTKNKNRKERKSTHTHRKKNVKININSINRASESEVEAIVRSGAEGRLNLFALGDSSRLSASTPSRLSWQICRMDFTPDLFFYYSFFILSYSFFIS